MTKTEIYKYIFNLRTNTNRKNFYCSRRRIDKGNGHKTLGWILSDDTNDNIVSKISFSDIIKIKQGLEQNA